MSATRVVVWVGGWEGNGWRSLVRLRRSRAVGQSGPGGVPIHLLACTFFTKCCAVAPPSPPCCRPLLILSSTTQHLPRVYNAAAWSAHRCAASCLAAALTPTPTPRQPPPLPPSVLPLRKPQHQASPTPPLCPTCNLYACPVADSQPPLICPPTAAQVKAKQAAAAERRKLAAALRLSAFEAWVRSGKKISVATRYFKQDNPAWRGVASRFIRTAVKGAAQRFSFEPSTSSGRKRKVPDDVAQRALDILWKGYTSEGHQRWFTSIDAACTASPRLRAITAKYKCTARTLLAAMRRIKGGCYRRRVVVKRPHKPANKLHRLDSCTKLLSWSRTRLRHTFWIDAATIWMCPKSRQVYAPPDGPLVCTDDRAPANSAELRKLKFYICINAILGPVALCYITGTTDRHGGGGAVDGERGSRGAGQKGELVEGYGCFTLRAGG